MTASKLPLITSFGKIIPADADATIFVREDKIREMITILNSPENRNVFLRGKAGTGKTATIYALAKYLSERECGARLKDFVVARLELGLIKSIGGGDVGKIEKTIKAIWDEATRVGNVILFVDEGHRISTGGADSVGNILKPLVTSGDVPMILATTNEEYRKYIEPDAAIKRRFQVVDIHEPDGETLLAILRNKGQHYMEELKVRVEEGIYKEIIETAHRYIHTSSDPDRCIRLLERACSFASARGEMTLVSEEDIREGLRIVAKVQLPPKAENKSVTEIAAKLKERIKGQDTAITKVAEFICSEQRGLFRNPCLPSSIFFVGARGCGKNELAKAVAKALGFSHEETIEIKMSAMENYNAVPVLLGSTGKDGENPITGKLSEPVRHNPHRFVIISEMERASAEAITTFGQILKNGEIQDGFGNEANFKNSVIVFTANVDRENSFGFSTGEKKEDEGEHLKKLFSEDFIESVGNFVSFAPVGKETIIEIIRSICASSPFGMKVDLSKEAEELISESVDYRKHGARKVRKVIEDTIRNLAMSNMEDVRNMRLSLLVKDGELVAESISRGIVC